MRAKLVMSGGGQPPTAPAPPLPNKTWFHVPLPGSAFSTAAARIARAIFAAGCRTQLCTDPHARPPALDAAALSAGCPPASLLALLRLPSVIGGQEMSVNTGQKREQT